MIALLQMAEFANKERQESVKLNMLWDCAIVTSYGWLTFYRLPIPQLNTSLTHCVQKITIMISTVVTEHNNLHLFCEAY